MKTEDVFIELFIAILFGIFQFWIFTLVWNHGLIKYFSFIKTPLTWGDIWIWMGFSVARAKLNFPSDKK